MLTGYIHSCSRPLLLAVWMYRGNEVGPQGFVVDQEQAGVMCDGSSESALLNVLCSSVRLDNWTYTSFAYSWQSIWMYFVLENTFYINNAEKRRCWDNCMCLIFEINSIRRVTLQTGSSMELIHSKTWTVAHGSVVSSHTLWWMILLIHAFNPCLY